MHEERILAKCLPGHYQVEAIQWGAIPERSTTNRNVSLSVCGRISNDHPDSARLQTAPDSIVRKVRSKILHKEMRFCSYTRCIIQFPIFGVCKTSSFSREQFVRVLLTICYKQKETYKWTLFGWESNLVCRTDSVGRSAVHRQRRSAIRTALTIERVNIEINELVHWIGALKGIWKRQFREAFGRALRNASRKFFFTGSRRAGSSNARPHEKGSVHGLVFIDIYF